MRSSEGLHDHQNGQIQEKALETDKKNEKYDSMLRRNEEERRVAFRIKKDPA